MSKHGWQTVALVAISALLLLLFWSTFYWLWWNWRTNEYYSHGPLIPLVAGYLAWRRRPQGNSSSPSNWGLLGLGGGLAGYLAGMALRAPFLSALAFIVVLGGLVWFLLGDEALRRWLFPLAYLILAVPLPFVDAFATYLQGLTAQAATALARLLGVSAISEGGRITLTSCSLVVGAPCSGMRSLVALLALAAVLAYLLRGFWLRRGILLGLAVPLAVVANVVRVLSLLLVADRWGEDMALRYWHTFSGLMFFMAALGLLIGAGWGLGCREIRSDI
ncbi:MAG: exosortase/archaeosortase family protein [Anaerolineae bacterium]|nr:exosortase/archaeosortase family protein [Anaerolineae bacterium]